MTGTPLAVVVLPGPGPAHEHLASTLESVRDEVGPEVPVVALASDAAGPRPAGGLVADLPVLSAAEAPRLAGVLAFVRPGDRWRPGTLAIRRLQLEAHPRAAFSVAAYAIFDAGGSEVITIRPPRPPIDPFRLLVRPSIEAATVLVRARSLDSDALFLLAGPYGGAVLWSRLARTEGLVSSDEIAAEVRLDPARHGHLPAARVAELIAGLSSFDEVEPAGLVTMRRELLRRLYLDPEPGIGEVDLACLLGERRDASRGARSVVADLQWALERQCEALELARNLWPEELSDEDHAVAAQADAELADLHAQMYVLGSEVVMRDAAIRRLEAEVYRRDAVITGLTERCAPAAGAAT